MEDRYQWRVRVKAKDQISLSLSQLYSITINLQSSSEQSPISHFCRKTPPAPSPGCLKGKKVIVLDDDQATLDLLTLVIQREGKFECTTMKIDFCRSNCKILQFSKLGNCRYSFRPPLGRYCYLSDDNYMISSRM